MPMPVPPRAEQDEIVAIIDDIGGAESANIAELEQLTNLKSALMQTLLTGELRVEPLP